MNRINILDIAYQDYTPELVKIDESVIKSINWPVATILPIKIVLPPHIAQSPLSSLTFMILLCSLNYRFWRLKDDKSIEKYRHNNLSGSRAAWDVLERYWGISEYPVDEFRKTYHEKGFEKLFGDMPGLEGRKAIMDEMLKDERLQNFSEGTVVKTRISGKIGVAQAAELAREFPKSFSDPYLKKSQLALSMFSGYLQGNGTKIETDFTAFADYQVPRVLKALGILHYDARLQEKVDSHTLLPEGDGEEVAIRAATILACKKIADHINGNDADVDNLLWQSQHIAGESRFHLTETTRY